MLVRDRGAGTGLLLGDLLRPGLDVGRRRNELKGLARARSHRHVPVIVGRAQGAPLARGGEVSQEGAGAFQRLGLDGAVGRKTRGRGLEDAGVFADDAGGSTQRALGEADCDHELLTRGIDLPGRRLRQ